MKIRRMYILECRKDKTLQKCLAIVLLLKSRLRQSRIQHYTINAVCRITSISHRTVKRYMRWMEEYGLIHFEGSEDNRVLVVNSLSSHTSDRNISIDVMDLSSFFAAYRSVQSFIFMRIQHNKDFIRHLLQSRHNPETPEEYRRARRKVRHLVKQGKLHSVDVRYKECGLSLKRISDDVGCCVRTVQRVVDYAVKKCWVERQHNFEWLHAPYVNHREITGFTFATRHKLCIVHPNTYTLSPIISQALSF